MTIAPKTHRPLTITVANEKGGVGKTSITRLLPYELASRGYKTLVVDADPQSNLTKTMGITRQRNEPNSIFVFDITMMAAVRDGDLSQAVFNIVPNLDVIPSQIDFKNFPTWLIKKYGIAEQRDPDYLSIEKERVFVLRRLLEPIKGNYDFIFIDTPPTTSAYTRNATVASDYVIIAFQTQSDSLDGAIAFINDDLKELVETFNAPTDVLGILPNQVTRDGSIDRVVVNDAIEKFGKQNMFTNIIPFAKRIQAIPRTGISKDGYWEGKLFREVIEPLTDDFLNRLKMVGEAD
ncbi:ParA family protein [uncultured Secundilactobacillus sp.]|uniref:ParA family protein n=1 Tax=uncultured Secundilactobacillus sp. TaxID=2813935 RepID=UPI0025868E3E|nr:AAA family ATPase [uncultured Secundilactobacillus sp.]